MARIKSKTDNRQIAVYTRKSKVTESGKSLEIQKGKCIALAQAQYDVSEADILVYEDEGKSGFYADRPQYRKMLRDIESNKIKAVICYKIDRISRRTVDLLNLVQQMEQKGIAFISVSDRELDTSTRTGKIMISLLSAIAEFERDIIAERITDNMYELAKEGRWLGGECPLGYSSKREKLTVNGRRTNVNHLEPVEEEQRGVSRLFKLFIRTGSFSVTAASLNKEGFKTKKHKDFTLAAVKNIIKNPVYAVADMEMHSYFTSLGVPVWSDEKDFDGSRGIMAYNKTEQTKEIDTESRALDPKYTQRNTRRDIKDWIIAVGRHRGVVSGADWLRAQKIIAEISHKGSARPTESSKALLSGLVRCGVCGGRMFVRAETGRHNYDGTPRFRYVCGAKYRKKGCCNNSPNIKGYELDNFVMEQICEMFISHVGFGGEIRRIKNAFLSKTLVDEKEISFLRKRISQIECDIRIQTTNLRNAPQNIKHTIYTDIESLCDERKENESRLREIYEEKLLRENNQSEYEIAKKDIADFLSISRAVGYQRKLQLLRIVLEYVEVDSESVHIYLKGAANEQ